MWQGIENVWNMYMYMRFCFLPLLPHPHSHGLVLVQSLVSVTAFLTFKSYDNVEHHIKKNTFFFLHVDIQYHIISSRCDWTITENYYCFSTT